MRTMISGVLILILWGGVPALAQLPPEIQADSYLLRAEQAIGKGNEDRARAEIDKINLLAKEHELDLPNEFHFRYAKAAAAAGMPEEAHEAVVKYLILAGREGQHYVEALELMNQVQDAIEASKESQEGSNEPTSPAQQASQLPLEAQLDASEPPEVPEEKPAQPNAAETTEAQTAPDCSEWNTEEYFKVATVEDVTVCLAAGADLEATDEDKWTPLHYAAVNQNPAVVLALLDASPDMNKQLNQRTTGGWTILHIAAAYNENPDIVKILLKAGADLTATDKTFFRSSMAFWWTPLHYAARNNENPEVVKALLDAGADPNRMSIHGTPLHLAAVNAENPAVIEVLLRAGADLKRGARGFLGRRQTPLHEAAENNENLAVIEFLLKAGADLKATDKDKRTTLHYAASGNENPAVIKFLLDAGLDLGARDKKGFTPMHLAASNNENPAVIEALLKAGANLAARNDKGRTPLDLAKENDENPAVEQVLLAAGAGRVERQLAAERARRKAQSGPGFLEAAIGIAGGTAIAAAGGGSDEALASGAVFAEGVMRGENPAVLEQRVEAAAASAGSTAGSAAAALAGTSGGGSCEIPGYPSPPGGAANLGLPWCPASVSMQARAFALQAAGAQCAIATGSSSTPAQVQARRREIDASCGRLAALSARGGTNCRCPPGLGGPGYSEDASSIDREQERREQQAKQQEEARQAAERERQARRAEQARQDAERRRNEINRRNAEIMSGNCSCISIKDNGEYTCMDGFVQSRNATKPLCDISR